jgi:tetratricopeptide (TPR) repeat protein
MLVKNQQPQEAVVFDELFKKGLQCHGDGRLTDAVSHYRKAIELAPNYHETYNNLGDVFLDQLQFGEAVTCYRRAVELAPHLPRGHFMLGKALQDQGHLDEAIICYRNAIKLHPNLPKGYYNLGFALAAQGQLDEAISCYRSAVDLKPDFVEAHNILGSALAEQGQLNEAISFYRTAIGLNQEFSDAHNNLGVALAEQGRLDEAIACYHSALSIKPDFLGAHNNLGNALRNQGRLDEAVVCYARALDLKPDFFEAHNNLGATLAEQGRLDEALSCYRKALDLQPEFWNSHFNLGNALREVGRLDEAVVCYGSAIDFNPDAHLVHINLGVTLFEQGRFNEALACYRKFLDLKPDDPDAYLASGNAYRALMRLDEAVVCYQKTLDLKPDDPDAHHNLAMALLARGDMATGWEEYEWRWKTQQMRTDRRNFSEPRWHGEKIDGRTLLIHAEQGFGDTLQFCRYAPLAAARANGSRIILDVPKELVRLLRDLPGVDLVVGYHEPLPTFDFQSPMLSLPWVLGTTMETIPGTTPYLHADKTKATGWHERLASIANKGPRIGLVWAGNPLNHSKALAARDRRRSLAAERLSPLLEIPGLHFFSLQKNGPAAPTTFPVINLMDEMTDFADTAALIANLDLVISVDTAVAHLAAALGKPVWMLNRFDSCWRWLTGRHDSPWYPTLRLYHQPQPGDWDSVVAKIVRDLRGFSIP